MLPRVINHLDVIMNQVGLQLKSTAALYIELFLKEIPFSVAFLTEIVL